jgi:hypothetical protein
VTWSGGTWAKSGQVAVLVISAVVVLGSINGVWGRYLRSDSVVSATARKQVPQRDGTWILGWLAA